MDTIQDSLELHPALPSLMDECVATPSSQRSGGMPIPLGPPLNGVKILGKSGEC